MVLWDWMALVGFGDSWNKAVRTTLTGVATTVI